VSLAWNVIALSQRWYSICYNMQLICRINVGTVWSYFLCCCHLSSINWPGLRQAHDFFWHSLSRERVPSRRVFVKFLERSLSLFLSSSRFARIEGTDDTLLHCATDYDFKCNANGVCSIYDGLQCLHCTSYSQLTAAKSWEATKRNVLSLRLYIEKTLHSPSHITSTSY
jgi:hypothetical protein